MKEKKAKKRGTDENIMVMYLKDINRYPLLTRDEEEEAARASAKGNIAARNKLVNGNLRFVINVAKRYTGLGIPLLDLINEGNIGLMRAAEKFDVNRGYHFISYAVHWIRQSILKAICEKSRHVRLPNNRVADLMRVEKAKAMLSGILGTDVAMKEIAQLLDMDENRVDDLLSISCSMISLEKSVKSDDETACLGDIVVDKRYETPENVAIQKALQDDIEQVLNTLDNKEADIIRCRFGLGTKHPASLKEIADRYDLSRERIRQIEHKALTHLQHPSRKEKLANYVA